MSEFTFTGIDTLVPELQTSTGFFFGSNTIFFKHLTDTTAPTLDEFFEASEIHPVDNVQYRFQESSPENVVLYKWEIF